MAYRASGIPVSSLVVDILIREYSRNTVSIPIQIEQEMGVHRHRQSGSKKYFVFISISSSREEKDDIVERGDTSKW